MRKLQRAALAAGITVAATAAGLGVAGAANATSASPAHGAQAAASWGGSAGVQANERVVESFLNDVLNEHHDATPFFTADAQWYGGTVGTVTGGRNIGGLFDGVYTALPDVHVTVKDIFGQGDQVVVHVVVGGTQEGAILGIPASGRPVQWDGVDIFRLSDGKIANITAGDDWTAILHDTGTYTAPWIS